jgi:glycogen debranching enzyme
MAAPPIDLSETTIVKAGNAFCVALRDGRLPLSAGHPLGLYLDDCRHLSGRELLLSGERPRLLAGSDAAGRAAVFELANAELTLTVRVERRMLPGGMVERIVVSSHATDPVELELELRLDADFRPMFEVRGLVEPAVREVRREAEAGTLRFSATGIDGLERSTTIRCPGAVAEAEGRLRLSLGLEPGVARTLDVELALAEQGAEGAAARRRPGPEAGARPDDRARIDVDDALVGRVLRRSLLDLRTLTSELDGRRYHAAGVPWFATLFGRDSIIAALQTLPLDPAMAEDTLRLLAARLGTRVDDEHDEEPGKVIHELRAGEVAAAGLSPFTRYFGSVDATPLFLCLLAEHADWTGSLDLFRALRPQVEATVRWIDEFGDLDGDGLLEYRSRSNGLPGHGWKDWPGAIADEHGVPLEAPIALVEAQGYALRAKRRLAHLFELDGDPARAEELRTGAERIAGALERFWLADRGFYAMALDAAGRPSRVLASNQGHLLWARAVPPERAAAIRDALMTEGAYSGWGVRTLSAGERAFHPLGYHTGCVWPHDNGLIATGLREYGHDAAFLRIFEDLLDAAGRFADHRLPELFAGFPRSDDEDPVPYPVACRPQAWAAGAVPALLVAGLGLVPDGHRRTLRVRRPLLPRQVDRLSVRGLRVAGASVDLRFERAADGVALADVRADGELEVALEAGDRVQGQ